MSISTVIKVVTVLNDVLTTWKVSQDSRDKIADAIKQGREITDEELDESFDELQNAIDQARKD